MESDDSLAPRSGALVGSLVEQEDRESLTSPCTSHTEA